MANDNDYSKYKCLAIIFISMGLFWDKCFKFTVVGWLIRW